MKALWLQAGHAHEADAAVKLTKRAGLTDLLCDADAISFPEVAARCAASGVRLHAWVWCNMVLKLDASWNVRHSQGESFDWLDFSLPEARSGLAALCRGIADSYGCDVHLDYVRWPSVSLYESRAYMTADAVTAAVRFVRNALPDRTLSAAVYATDDRYTPGQHWRTWTNVTPIPMMYGDAARLRKYASTWPVGTVPGLAFEYFDFNAGRFTRPFSPAEVLTVVAEGRAWGFDDFAFYDYRKLADAGARMVAALGSAFGGQMTIADDVRALAALVQQIQLGMITLDDLCKQAVNKATQLETDAVTLDDKLDALADVIEDD